MRLYKKKFAYRDLLLSVLVFCAVLFLFWSGFNSTLRANNAEKLRVTRAAIQKAVVNCYAVEGSYPPDIKYLEDHYGIAIDYSKYVVQYETAGNNIMPSVQVLEKGADS
ncbi:hypothetical protein [Caproiciproducens sp.]|uniref:hypothetical protein n=1 Tax=Caproiciproducens sp. TaxID=1954376 RepID=UPI0028977A72|nr:hypothetical protein [Caproiciproducens sp.]